MRSENYIKIEFPSRSVNEGFARAAAAARGKRQYRNRHTAGRNITRKAKTISEIKADFFIPIFLTEISPFKLEKSLNM